MKWFAELDENNIVKQVLILDDDAVQNLPFPESEPVGEAYLNSFLPPSVWKETCYEGLFRFRYAGTGMKFHPECGSHGGFSMPKIDDTFIWDESVCNWVPPIPYPTDGRKYEWIQELNRWSVVLQNPPATTFIG